MAYDSYHKRRIGNRGRWLVGYELAGRRQRRGRVVGFRLRL